MPGEHLSKSLVTPHTPRNTPLLYIPIWTNIAFNNRSLSAPTTNAATAVQLTPIDFQPNCTEGGRTVIISPITSLGFLLNFTRLSRKVSLHNSQAVAFYSSSPESVFFFNRILHKVHHEDLKKHNPDFSSPPIHCGRSCPCFDWKHDSDIRLE